MKWIDMFEEWKSEAITNSGGFVSAIFLPLFDGGIGMSEIIKLNLGFPVKLPEKGFFF